MRADDEMKRADDLKKELVSMKRANAAEGPRMPFKGWDLILYINHLNLDLSTRRQQEIVKDMRDKLEGSGYSVIKDADSPVLDVQKSFSYFYMEGLTEQQYKEGFKVPKRKFLKLN